MSETLAVQIRRLQDMSVAELRTRYREVFGEESRSRNKDYLLKRVAWGIQARAEGGLSERARKRAAELADEIHLRVRGTNAEPPPPRKPARDPRLPAPGSELRRTHNDVEHVVTVLDGGFLYQGQRYKSLSAVARAITGSQWNGYLFFGLTGRGKEARA